MRSITPSDQAPGLTFPALHVLIAMGPPDEAFARSIEAALISAGARRSQAPLASKLSRTGRFQSVHVEVHVDSREELEALYAVLKAHPDVVYRL